MGNSREKYLIEFFF